MRAAAVPPPARWTLAPLLFVALVLVTLAGPDASTAAARERSPEGWPVLHARSATLSWRVDGRWHPGDWRADPTLALDVLELSPRSGPRRLAIVSEIDSIEFVLEPQDTVTLVVVLNGRDSCRTRIQPSPTRYRRAHAGAVVDSLPFTLDDSGRIVFQVSIDDSEPLNMQFDTGAYTNVVCPSAFKKGFVARAGATVASSGTGGVVERRTSAGHRMTLGASSWDGVAAILLEKPLGHYDGILGIGLFDGRVVSFDFDRRIATVADSLDRFPAGHRALPMGWMGDLPTVAVELDVGGKTLREPFVLNTGGTGLVRITRDVVERHALDGVMRRIGGSMSSGVGPERVPNDVVILPAFTIAGQTFRNLPVDLERPHPGSPGGAQHVGMRLLSRFHLVFDFRRDTVYFAPNRRISLPVAAPRLGGRAPLWIGAAIVAALGAAVAVTRRRAGRAA